MLDVRAVVYSLKLALKSTHLVLRLSDDACVRVHHGSDFVVVFALDHADKRLLVVLVLILVNRAPFL